MGKVILDLCSGSGAWSKPYVDAGYDVRCITLPDDIRLQTFPGKVHGILAAPPCTVFAQAGFRWPRTDDDYRQALSVVDACLRFVVTCSPEWWCLENPVGKLKRWLGRWTMTFNPCDYGDPYTKRTCLWGRFNPPVKNPVAPILGSKIHTFSNRVKRSITPDGFARAFFQANP